MSKLIRVISTPRDRPCTPVEKKWVGVVLPLASEKDIQKFFSKGKKQPRGTYIVTLEDALEALRQNDQESAVQFFSTLHKGRDLYLIFEMDCCAEVK